MKELIRPLKEISKREYWLWGSLIVLLVVKIIIGDRTFFENHFYDLEWPLELGNWYKWLYHHIASLVLWFVMPLLIIKKGLKDSLKDYGLGIGDWKFGLFATLIAVIIMPFSVYIASQSPDHRAFYPLTTIANESVGLFALWGLCYLPHYIGWEFLFRGFVGLGFRKSYGVAVAMGTHVIITTLLHIGKPNGELVGAAIGGVYLGLLTYRTGSIWWAVIFHFYLGMLNTWMCG